MAIKVGINGFGRIGRLVLRAIRARGGGALSVVAINDIAPLDQVALLLKHDTTYGDFPEGLAQGSNSLRIGDCEIRVYRKDRPEKIAWRDHAVDVVVESSGHFTARADAREHITSPSGGVKAVVITAPATGADATFVMGVNHATYHPAKHRVISNASCTTHCLAVQAKVLHEAYRIRRGLMDTVHAATNDQRVVDQAHPSDPRRMWSTLDNILPTDTGAATTVGMVLPELAGKLTGRSLRVPTKTVSIICLDVETEQSATDACAVNDVFRQAATGALKGLLAVSDEPLASSCFKQHPASCVIDAPLTIVLEGTRIKTYGWYDNEWMYACRTVDLLEHMAIQGLL